MQQTFFSQLLLLLKLQKSTNKELMERKGMRQPIRTNQTVIHTEGWGAQGKALEHLGS